MSGHTCIPNEVIANPTISAGAFRTYCALRSFLWEKPDCWPSHVRIAAMVGLRREAVARHVRELCRAGVLTAESRADRKSCTYTFPHEVVRSSAQPTPEVVREIAQPEQEVVREIAHKENTVEENTTEEDERTSRVHRETERVLEVLGGTVSARAADRISDGIARYPKREPVAVALDYADWQDRVAAGEDRKHKKPQTDRITGFLNALARADQYDRYPRRTEHAPAKPFHPGWRPACETEEDSRRRLEKLRWNRENWKTEAAAFFARHQEQAPVAS